MPLSFYAPIELLRSSTSVPANCGSTGLVTTRSILARVPPQSAGSRAPQAAYAAELFQDASAVGWKEKHHSFPNSTFLARIERGTSQFFQPTAVRSRNKVCQCFSIGNMHG